MDMFTDMQTMQSMLSSASYSLRYEITFGAVLLAVWLIGRVMTIQHKSKKHPGFNKQPGRMHQQTPKRNSLSEAHQGRFRKSTGDSIDSESSPNSSSQLGKIDDIDPKLLRDPAWLVPQVLRLCRSQLKQSLTLYRAALDAGLKLQDMPEIECQQLFAALVASSIRTNHMQDMMQLLKDLRQHGLGVCESILSSVVKLCTSKQLFKECLTVYDFIADDPAFTISDKSLWSCLLFCAIESRCYDRCGFFFERIKSCGVPSHKDYGNMVRHASLRGDWRLPLSLMQEMHVAGIDIDGVIYNTSLATCVSADQVDEARSLLEDMEQTAGLADVVAYNTVMKGYAKAGRMEQCFEVFQRLKQQNIVPSPVTYGILLDGFINDNQLDRAADLFKTMVSEGCPMNTVLFTTLIKGFVRAGDVDQAMKVYEQMRFERNVTPDLITFSILIKANCDAGRLETGLKLLDAMVNLNMRPDEVVFNNLLSGCARQESVELGRRLYADMIASGIRPSNATFSIMIRFFHQCKLLEDAVEMLRTEPAKHNIDIEPRLFLQLIQSCIRERQGRRALEVYDMLTKNSPPTAAAHSSIISTCLKLNMFGTAAEILETAASKKYRVDKRDADALLQGASRKRKADVVREIAASITKLGFSVDPKLVAAAGASPA